jgi:hypothetical protein
VHLNHWWLVAGSGKPPQVPDETVRIFPVALVPVTTGDTWTQAELVTNEVDPVYVSVDSSAIFIAVTLAMRRFPTSS